MNDAVVGSDETDTVGRSFILPSVMISTPSRYTQLDRHVPTLSFLSSDLQQSNIQTAQ